MCLNPASFCLYALYWRLIISPFSFSLSRTEQNRKDFQFFQTSNFSDTRSSFENTKVKWAPEIKHAAPGKPFILVGNKSDLRETEVDLVSTAEGIFPIFEDFSICAKRNQYR